MISHAEFCALVHYDPETGIFTRRVATGRWNRSSVGSEMGKKSREQGRRYGLRLRGKLYAAHRVAWFYQTGDWPAAEVDHINGDPSDNRFANLRLATRLENGRNLKRSKANTSGYKGVSYHPVSKKWCAKIQPSRNSIHLGLFETPQQAHEAYMAAAVKYFGEFAKGG